VGVVGLPGTDFVAAVAGSLNSVLAGWTTVTHIDMKQVGGERLMVVCKMVEVDIEVEKAEAEGMTVAVEEQAVAGGMNAAVEVEVGHVAVIVEQGLNFVHRKIVN